MLTLTEYCEKILIKIEGIKTVKDYYELSTCTDKLDKIKIPTFFLNALDDPIIGSDQIPLEHNHEHILIGVTKSGGHLSHFEGHIFPQK